MRGVSRNNRIKSGTMTKKELIRALERFDDNDEIKVATEKAVRGANRFNVTKIVDGPLGIYLYIYL